VEITCEDDRLETVLRYLANSAEQAVPVKGGMHYRVGGDGPYELFEEGDRVTAVSTPDDVLFVLYQRCYGRLMDHLTLGGWLPLHGAIATVAGRRMLIVGDKGAGKTTLTLRLLHDGHAVEGDELVFTRGGLALPMPRLLHIKPGTAEVIPELVERVGRLPATSTSDGMRIAAFDPATAGFPWRIALGAVDAAFVLRPRFSGPTACRPLSTVDLVRYVVDHTLPMTASRSALLGACASLLRDTDGFELFLGDLAGSAAVLTSATR
jgi:hypothetical protein